MCFDPLRQTIATASSVIRRATYNISSVGTLATSIHSLPSSPAPASSQFLFIAQFNVHCIIPVCQTLTKPRHHPNRSPELLLITVQMFFSLFRIQSSSILSPSEPRSRQQHILSINLSHKNVQLQPKFYEQASLHLKIVKGFQNSCTLTYLSHKVLTDTSNVLSK